MSQLQWTYIDTDEQLTPLLEALVGVELVPFDLEADSMYCYRSKICLLQLTIRNKNYVVDPLGQITIQRLVDSLKGKTLIAHGSDYDLRMMRDHWGFSPTKVFDTMLAACYLGDKHFGLGAVIHKHFNVVLDKTNQKAQWSQRPLPQGLVEYAALDTFYLLELYNIQMAELNRMSRKNWLEEHCQHLIDVVKNEDLTPDPDRWRIKGASSLNRRQLGALQLLWDWREGRAAIRNIPAFKILPNEKMIELVTRYAGKQMVDPEKLPRLPKNFTPELKQQICTCLESSAKLTLKNLPLKKRIIPPSAPSPHPAVMEALRNQREKFALTFGIESHLFGNKNQLVAMALTLPKEYSQVEKIGMMKWQWDLWLPKLAHHR